MHVLSVLVACIWHGRFKTVQLMSQGAQIESTPVTERARASQKASLGRPLAFLWLVALAARCPFTASTLASHMTVRMPLKAIAPLLWLTASRGALRAGLHRQPISAAVGRTRTLVSSALREDEDKAWPTRTPLALQQRLYHRLSSLTICVRARSASAHRRPCARVSHALCHAEDRHEHA